MCIQAEALEVEYLGKERQMMIKSNIKIKNRGIRGEIGDDELLKGQGLKGHWL